MWEEVSPLRSRALSTLLLVYICHIEFLKSLDLRGFLAIVGTLLFVFIWSLFNPVLAYFVSKMLAWANLVLSTEFPNNKNRVLIKTPIDSSATDSVLLGIDNSIKLLTCFMISTLILYSKIHALCTPVFGNGVLIRHRPRCFATSWEFHRPVLRRTVPVANTYLRPCSFTWYW